MYREEDLLPVSALADLVYCERRAALHHLEFIWEDSSYTVEGTNLHEKVHAEEATEARGDIWIARGLRLHSLRLGLSGKTDVVEFHRALEGELGTRLNGTAGLWLPMPVEYKRGVLHKEEGYEVQLCAQAICLEEMLNVPIPAGAIFYGKSRHRLDIVFNGKLRGETELAAARLHELLARAATPKAVQGPKCGRCSLLDRCLPATTDGQHSVRKYLSKAIAENSETPA